ncbi:hypothetical protein [Nocardiopsis sp. FIRDI 009]|uniref:hypothetical protein n=1 Tax=Nocardiopsis sp. FIRDI 009 TaxID=714197 RepID=UPI000E254F29|nr:hypothetical protein [Nocardiopsis sp. FIRDI 009]
MTLTEQTRTQARESLARDREEAARLPELLKAVAEAEAALAEARERNASATELRHLGLVLDGALTEAMRAAYARERVLVGARGYRDRIYRRKRLARPEVREATRVAERLLTAREEHRLHGIQRIPRPVA